MIFAFNVFVLLAVVDDAIKKVVADNPDFWTVTFPAMVATAVFVVGVVAGAAVAVTKIVMKAIHELKALMQFNTDETIKGVTKINEIKSDATDAKATASAAATIANRANVKAEVATAKAETAVVKAEAAQGSNTEATAALMGKMDTVIENVNGKLDKNVALSHEAGIAKGQRDALLEKANSHGERLGMLEGRMTKVEVAVTDGFKSILEEMKTKAQIDDLRVKEERHNQRDAAHAELWKAEMERMKAEIAAVKGVAPATQLPAGEGLANRAVKAAERTATATERIAETEKP